MDRPVDASLGAGDVPRPGAFVFAAKLVEACGESRIQQMVGDVGTLRALVRIKVQDNNDLATAEQVVQDTWRFLDGLQQAAKDQTTAEVQLLQQVRVLV